MAYTLQQELSIHDLAKDKVRVLHDELNDKKNQMSDHQRAQLIHELKKVPGTTVRQPIKSADKLIKEQTH